MRNRLLWSKISPAAGLCMRRNKLPLFHKDPKCQRLNMPLASKRKGEEGEDTWMITWEDILSLLTDVDAL